MRREGPTLEALTRRLAECPPAFLEEPRIGSLGTIRVNAVVADLLRALGGVLTDASMLHTFTSRDPQRDRNRLSMVLIACWMFADPWFPPQHVAPAVLEFLRGPTLGDMVGTTAAGRFVEEDDRREELVRTGLATLGFRPLGETEEQASDRLTTLSSVERRRVMDATRAAEARASVIRDEMRKKAAAEAAARHTRE